MKYLYRYILIVFFTFCLSSSADAQSGWGIGASGLYNINNDWLGVSGRVYIPVQENLWAVPYVYSYLSTGEVSWGVSGLVVFARTRALAWYLVGSGTLRVSATASVNDSTASQSHSLSAQGEAGIGVFIGGGCLKPFVEPKYGIQSEEFTLRIGLAYFFSCGGGKKKGGKRKGGGKSKAGKSKYSKRKAPVCPAYE